MTARPGLDRYVYTFRTSACNLPDIGRRGDFLSGPNSFPARLIDRRGPTLSISLKADKPLGPGLSGSFRPLPPLPVPAPALPADELPLPPGAALFLDSQDGWVMSAAEAAGNKVSSFDSHYWPAVAGDDIAGHLSPSGLTFVWRPKPSESPAVIAALAEYFFREHGRVLIASEAPAGLESLAELEGAVFSGEASPGTPLHPVSIYTKAAEAREAREVEQAGLRNDLSLLKSKEAAVKARLNLWEDLDELEQRFEKLGREVAEFRRQWERSRHDVEQARTSWEECRAVRDKSGPGLLSWVRQGGSNKKAVQREEESRQTLEEIEAAMRLVRREEESALEEARRLESRLRLTRLESENWAGRPQLAAELAELRNRQDQVASQLAASVAQAPVDPESFLAGAGLILALADDLSPGEILADQRFTALLVLTSHPPDHEGRQKLASLALKAERHLVIFGDFTFWPVWSGPAPTLPGRPDVPAWAGLMVAEERDELKFFLAEDGLFSQRTLPAESPSLSRMELGSRGDAAPLKFTYIVPPSEKSSEAEDSGIEWSNLAENPTRLKKNIPLAKTSRGIGFRAVGEIGPANPVSALAAARAAVNFASGFQSEGPAVVILTASAAQAGLINLMLRDLKAPASRIYCGEPPDFIHWPQVPLVILEPAFEAPHLSHPWSWPSFGRQRLMWAWRLASEQIWLTGRDGWMRRLPEASPLGALWALASSQSQQISLSAPTKEIVPTFWEALDKARQDVWAIVPVFETYWWRPLEEHFLAAARRRVAITFLAAPPGPESDREYVSQAIRTLSAYGCHVYLAEGFPGFMAMVDGSHLTWGHFIEGGRGAHVWGGLKSAVIPDAGPEIGEIIQLRLIAEKMGRRGGGLRNCPKCGWPMVVINQDQVRGFGDEQPLKLGCLGCQSQRAARRLDERDPFMSPPRCGLNRDLLYQRVWRNRQEFWVCPDHPDGHSCPSFRILPGDVK